jgi:hypothetical protein
MPGRHSRRAISTIVAALCAAVSLAHSPRIDFDTGDWCLGASENTYENGGRIENSATLLACGRCSDGLDACLADEDCNAVATCIERGSKVETVWWDDRTDAAVNDLATLATTQDDTHLYFAIEQWVSPDPVSLPFYEIAIDVGPGGIAAWHDPLASLTDPGHCSAWTDRACTSDVDCHFCALSTEDPPSTRLRTCGSGCHPDFPGDVCDTSQVCIGAGSGGPIPAAGANAVPTRLADYLVVVDLSRFLLALEAPLAIMKADGGAWSTVATVDFPSNPGTSGATIPAVALELAVPWTAFSGDLAPGETFHLGMTVARGTITLDYTPDGPIEDALTEAVAGTTTSTPDDCPGTGTTTTLCELADGSQDAFFPVAIPEPGGEVQALRLERVGKTSIRLDWEVSCSPADGDHAVYVGLLGDFTSHAPVPGLCSTGGSTSAAVPVPGGDAFYLVVPGNGSTEGSYGTASDGSERPPGISSCLPQQLGNCPD